jgi:predicted TIM-barrel fold metal-dependent hydrolase
VTQPLDRDQGPVAQTVHPDPVHPRAREVGVIDTDFHVTPEFGALRQYLPEPFRTKLQSYPLTGAEYDARYAISMEDSGLSVQGTATDGATITRVMDQIGVRTVLLTPGLRPINYFNLKAANAIACAYNDFLAREVLPVHDGIRAYIMINQRDPDAAAAEIRRVAPNDRFVGVYAEFGAHEPIATARHDPIYDALAAYDLPLALHASGFWPSRSQLATGIRTWTEAIGIAWPCFAMVVAGAMILQGVFDKYPRQMVLLQEGGLWWIIEFMLRVDEFYLDHPGDIQMVERKLERGESFLRKLPSEYLREHFRFATQPICKPKSPRQFATLLELTRGEDLLVYSSDWPHATFDPPNWVFESGSAISEEAAHRILHGNAERLFPRLSR